MPVIGATLKLYRNVLSRTTHAAVRNWRLALVTPAYLIVVSVAIRVAAPLGGMLGGLVVGLVQAACFSLVLHLLDEAVSDGGRVRWRDFRSGFGTYFGQVIRLLFLFYIVGLVTGPLFAGGDGFALHFVLRLVVATALNAVPELLYIGREKSFAALGESVRFIQQNWIEWFLPVVLGGWLLVALDPWLWIGASGAAGLGAWATVLNPLQQVQVAAVRVALLQSGTPALIASGVLSALVFHFLMLLRGFLFRALTAHSPRTRIYRHRMGLD